VIFDFGFGGMSLRSERFSIGRFRAEFDFQASENHLKNNWCFKPVKEQEAHTMHPRARFSSNFLHLPAARRISILEKGELPAATPASKPA